MDYTPPSQAAIALAVKLLDSSIHVLENGFVNPENGEFMGKVADAETGGMLPQDPNFPDDPSKKLRTGVDFLAGVYVPIAERLLALNALASLIGPRRKETLFVYLAAFDLSTGARKAGLAGSMIVNVSKDGGSLVPSTNPPEDVGAGIYSLQLTSAEMDAKTILVEATAPGAVLDMLEIYTSPDTPPLYP
jgi:hypothetical protein